MTDNRKDSVSFQRIDAEDAGQRIDNYLMRILKGVPKSHIYRILRSGEVRVNRGRIDASYRLADGDEIRIPPVRTAERPPSTAPGADFPVVYEDNFMLVIDKPSGVAVHGGSGVSFGVIEQLRKAHPEYRFLELAHRLDRETSGLLMLAKKRSALLKLHDMMRDNIPDKRYLALGIAPWQGKGGSVRFPLHKYLTADGERRVCVDDAGQASHTIFTVMERLGRFTLMEARLKSGRTHQIRVHMAASGCQIAGDEKYGDLAFNRELARHGLRRMFLHAFRLTLPHPISGETLTLEAPLPTELSAYLDKLRKNGQDL
jgi:23S rRNA pseudouridine955/2504/2580 synthase